MDFVINDDHRLTIGGNYRAEKIGSILKSLAELTIYLIKK